MTSRGRERRARRRGGRGGRGFTFLGLLFLVMLMALMATAAATTWQFIGQRDKEAQLLFVGREYRSAIARYAAAHARERQPYPSDLAQLLGDDAGRLTPVRYLRRLYFDPITGDADWGLVKTPLGGITGIYSRSSLRPLRRRAEPDDETIDFARAASYRDWVFGVQPVVPGAIPGWNYQRDGEPPPQWGAGGPPEGRSNAN